MKDLTGRKVIMGKRYAKWHLDHPEIYVYPHNGRMSHDYEEETQLHLMCLLGNDIPGIITGLGHDCYHVVYKLAGLTAAYYVDRKDFTLI